MILRIADDHDRPAAGFDCIAFRNGFGGVIHSLCMEVGPDLANDSAHVFFRKNDNRVHICQCGEDFRTLLGGHNRSSLAFKLSYRSIGVHCDDQPAPKFMRGMQIADMAHVQHVKTPVSQGNAISPKAPLRDPALQFVARNNLWLYGCAQ